MQLHQFTKKNIFYKTLQIKQSEGKQWSNVNSKQTKETTIIQFKSLKKLITNYTQYTCKKRPNNCVLSLVDRVR